MAIDLRFILSVIKINADLERVGDAAKSITERVRNMEQMRDRGAAGRYSADGYAGCRDGAQESAGVYRG